MKRRLALRRVTREDLAQHLREVEVTAAEAIGEASVYHCRGKAGESVAVALPGESGLIVEIQAASPPPERRRRKRVAAPPPAE